MLANTNQQSAVRAAIQFNLRQLFKLISLCCLFFALVQATGTFFAALVAGLFFLLVLLTALRIETIVHGALFGTCCSIAILALVGLAFPPKSNWFLFLAWLSYPLLGYTIGLVCAADRELRLG
jgi:hypothetical protein